MGTNKIQLVYILAASHSGSTLTAMLLGAHPEVCTIGEIKATSFGDTNHYRCSCLEKIKDCKFWKDISQNMTERGFSFDITNAGTEIRSGASPYVQRLLRPLHRGPVIEKLRDIALSFSPIWRKQLPQIQAINTNLMESVLNRTDKKIIVDSSKIGIRLKYLLRNPALEVKIVRLVRDGRGVALTYVDPYKYADASDPNLRGGGIGEERDKERLTMAEAAREWRRCNEEAEAILGQLDSSMWTTVRYEDLCEQPDETLRKIFSFIGVDPNTVRQDFRSIEHHIIGNGMRFNSTSEISLDERWKSVLSEKDLRIFDEVAGNMSRKLGYPVSYGTGEIKAHSEKPRQ